MSDFDSCQFNRTHTGGLHKWKASQVVQDLLWHLTSAYMKCVYGWAYAFYVITKFSRIDSLPNFVTHGAALESSAIINNQVEVMREADISVIALPCAEQWGDAKHCFLKTESYHRHARFLDSWLKLKNTARVLLTWLLQCEQNLIGWSSVCDLLNHPPTCNALTNTLKKKILCSFKGTGWMPSTIEIYKATTSPTIIRCTDLFRLRTSFSPLFRRRSREAV